MEKQVLLDLVADDLSQNKFADPCRAYGQHSFIEAPLGDDPRGEHIGVQEQPNSTARGHFACEDRRGPRFADFVAP